MPLAFAIDHTDVRAVELLIQAGADVDFTGSDGMHPLYVCLQQNNLSIFDALLSAGANAGNAYVVPETQGTLLYMAIVQNQVDFARSILDRYPEQLNTNCGRDYVEQFPLTVAATVCRDLDMVEMFLQRKADPNPNSPAKPLHVAACLGKTELACKLLSEGANVHMLVHTSLVPMFMRVNVGYMSPFSLAVSAGHLDLAHHLIEKHGAKAPGDKCLHTVRYMFEAEKASAALMDKLILAGTLSRDFCFRHPTTALLDLALECGLYRLAHVYLSHGICPLWRYTSTAEIRSRLSDMPERFLVKLSVSGALSGLPKKLKNIVVSERLRRGHTVHSLSEICIGKTRYFLQHGTGVSVWVCIERLRIPALLKDMLKLK